MIDNIPEDLIQAAGEEIQHLVNEALQRVIDSPPANTVGMAVAFMVTTDLIGPEAAHEVTLAEFFALFTAIYKSLTRDEE